MEYPPQLHWIWRTLVFHKVSNSVISFAMGDKRFEQKLLILRLTCKCKCNVCFYIVSCYSKICIYIGPLWGKELDLVNRGAR